MLEERKQEEEEEEEEGSKKKQVERRGIIRVKEIEIQHVSFAVMGGGVSVGWTDKRLVQTRRIVFTESPNEINLNHNLIRESQTATLKPL